MAPKIRIKFSFLIKQQIFMRKFLQKCVFFIIPMLLSSFVAFSQGTVSGKVIDGSSSEALPGVSVLIKGHKGGTSSEIDGSFKLKLQTGQYTLVFNYVGYLSKELNIEVTGSHVTNLGLIKLASSSLSMSEVTITAGQAVERKTPVAISTIKATDIENKSANSEFPELLKSMPSVYTSKVAGGFGDSRVTIRGFDGTNVAVMINGVPVNGMEDGKVYWSNWSGLTDIASTVQVQRGIGASKLSVSSVGGTINVVTKPTEMEAGGMFKNSIGNDGFQKYTLGYNTGLLKSGFAISALGSYTSGDGYIDGTAFRGGTYFLSAGWKINEKHTLVLTATGAPQSHDQSYATYYQNYVGNPNNPSVIARGRKYNYESGFYSGEYQSYYKNKYHKPVINLNHYWKLDDYTDINSVVYASFGRGNGTANLGTSPTSSMFVALDGTLNFNDIKKFNTGSTIGTTAGVPLWATDGEFNGKYVTTSSKGVTLFDNVNNHNWYGAIINGARQIGEDLKISAGLDYRYYSGDHYYTVRDLFGADAYYDANTGQFATEGSNTKVNYNYTGYVNWIGGYLSAEYSNDLLDIFASGTLNNSAYKRKTYLFASLNGKNMSDVHNFLGYSGKGGINFKISEQHNFFGNVGYFERAPLFNTVFQSYTTNAENADAKNEKIQDYELGYGFRSRLLTVKLNGYYTKWTDRAVYRSVVTEGGTTYYNFTGLGELHKGLELEVLAKPIQKLELSGSYSMGKWKYTSDASGKAYNDAGDVIADGTTAFKGLKVGGTAQTTGALSANYEVLKGLRIMADYNYYDKLYSTFTTGGTASTVTGQWELPSFGLYNAGLSYSFKLKNLPVTLRANVDNVFDKQYLAETTNSVLYNSDDSADFEIGKGGSGKSSYVYWGFGTTWTAGLSVRF